MSMIKKTNGVNKVKITQPLFIQITNYSVNLHRATPKTYWKRQAPVHQIRYGYKTNYYLG